MKKLPFPSERLHVLIPVVLGILITGLLIFLSARIPIAPLHPAGQSQFAKATVTKVISNDDSNQSVNTGTPGNQVVELKITSGPFSGKSCQAISPNVSNSGAHCVPGLNVIARIVPRPDGQFSATVYNYDRGIFLWVLIGLFFFLLCLTGGKKGITSSAALIFTFVCIVFLYIPLMYIGVSPFWAASLAAAVITCMTMFLIGGWSSKTVCSIVGTLAGILAAGLTAQLFGTLAHISGLNVSEFEVLAYIGMYSKLNVSEVLFSGILISSLGAVMDISMSVASVVSEIHSTAPELSAKELFQSGMRVGRDMMGTMSATLILAYAGGSINTLIIIYAYSMPYLQYINGYDIGINILSGISGAIGVILTVPFVSAVSAFIMTRREKR